MVNEHIDILLLSAALGAASFVSFLRLKVLGRILPVLAVLIVYLSHWRGVYHTPAHFQSFVFGFLSGGMLFRAVTWFWRRIYTRRGECFPETPVWILGAVSLLYHELFLATYYPAGSLGRALFPRYFWMSVAAAFTGVVVFSAVCSVISRFFFSRRTSRSREVSLACAAVAVVYVLFPLFDVLVGPVKKYGWCPELFLRPHPVVSVAMGAVLACVGYATTLVLGHRMASCLHRTQKERPARASSVILWGSSAAVAYLSLHSLFELSRIIGGFQGSIDESWWVMITLQFAVCGLVLGHLVCFAYQNHPFLLGSCAELVEGRVESARQD